MKYLVKNYPTIENFVERGLRDQKIQKILHFAPQSYYICGTPFSKPDLSFIAKFERLESDFGEISNRLGVEKRLPRLNQGSDHYTENVLFSNPRLRSMIEDHYANDMKMLGYE